MLSERTFADRLGRAQLLVAAISGFDTAYSAPDPNIHVHEFTNFLAAIAQQNLDVNRLRNDYTTSVTERIAMVKDVKKRSGMTRSFVDAVSAYSSHRTTIRNIVKKILNYKTVKPKLPEGSPTPPKRNKGEQSFADLAGLLHSLISAVSSIPNYKPPNNELQIAEMVSLFNSFDTKNQMMNTLASNISLAVNKREIMYEAPDGLKERMRAVKAAVRAQYGPASSEYMSIKGINL